MKPRITMFLLVVSFLVATWSSLLYYCFLVYFVIGTPGRMMLQKRYMPDAEHGSLLVALLLYLPVNVLVSWLLVRRGKLNKKWFSVAAALPVPSGVLLFEILNLLR